MQIRDIFITLLYNKENDECEEAEGGKWREEERRGGERGRERGRERKGEEWGEGEGDVLPKEAFLGLLLNSTTSSAMVCFMLEYSISGLLEGRGKPERVDK